MRVLLVALLIAAVPSMGMAQSEPSSTEMAAARELFRSGLEHARASEWEAARGDFERSYEIAQVPTTLLNLAGAQKETGQLVGAAESYRSFLQVATSGRARRYRAQAETALAELETLIPRVTISASNTAEGDTLHLDDAEIAMAVLGTAIPVDPGDHVITVQRAGSEVAREELNLMAGEERAVALAVPELMPTTLEPEPEPHPAVTDDRSVAKSPWLWTGVALVVVGAVLTAVLLTRDGGNEYSGNIGDGRIPFE